MAQGHLEPVCSSQQQTCSGQRRCTGLLTSGQRCVAQIQLSIVRVNIFVSMQGFLCLKNYHLAPSCFEQLRLGSSAFFKEKVPF